MTNSVDIEQHSKGPRSFISANFVLLFIAHLIIVSIYFLFMTTMARHALQVFECSSSTAGLIASIFLVGAAFARIMAGRYADALGLKRCSVAAVVLMLASCLLYPAAETSLGTMLALRFVHGMAFGVANTTMPAIATQIIPLEVMGEGTGWFMLSNSLGVGLGPLVGLLVTQGLPYDTLYTTASLLAAIAIAATIPLSAGKVPPEGTKAALRDVPKFKLSHILDPKTRKFSFFMFLVALSYSSINAFVDPYSDLVGLNGWAPALFLTYSISLILMRPPVGRLQDRKGDNAVLYPSIASMALGTLSCALCWQVPTPLLLILAGFFSATGFGTCMSGGLAVIGRMSGGSKAAPGIATFYLLCDFGCGIGPFLLGFIVSSIGYVGMYVVCSLIALVGVAYYHFAHGRAH